MADAPKAGAPLNGSALGIPEKLAVRDPHVQMMYYAVSSDEGISYASPEPLSFTNRLGVFDLDLGKLRIAAAEHFPSEAEARLAIEPYLRAWELEADLQSNVGMIRFTFERAELIDRDPPPLGTPQVIQLKGIASVCAVGHVSVHQTYLKYPQPPSAFRATLDVEHAYRRWLGYRSGKEPLQAMAYFVLTLFESAAGGRKNAARSFNIDIEVLGTIGKLSSTKGDPITARKVVPGTPLQELTGAERVWLEKAIPLVIRRVGEHASGIPLVLISLADLPSI